MGRDNYGIGRNDGKVLIPYKFYKPTPQLSALSQQISIGRLPYIDYFCC